MKSIGVGILGIGALATALYEAYYYSPLSVSLLGPPRERYHTMMVEEGYALSEETMISFHHQRCGEPYTIIFGKEGTKIIDYSLESGITITVFAGNEKTIYEDSEGAGLVDTYQKLSVAGKREQELEYLRPQTIPLLVYQSGEALEQNPDVDVKKSLDAQLEYLALLTEFQKNEYQPKICE